ncbi:MAG: helix-turn-helix domain-containing protein [Chloroflexota bacterium]
MNTKSDVLVGGHDRGCELAPACLECPFERCLLEEPRGRQRLLLARRDALIAQLRREGKGTRHIARELGISQRTVQRAVARQRKASPPHSISLPPGER